MLDGDQLHPDSFLARHLYSAVVSTKSRIVIGGIMTTIARFFGIEPNPKDRVSGFEQLNQVAFKIMNFCRLGARRFYLIYYGD